MIRRATRPKGSSHHTPMSDSVSSPREPVGTGTDIVSSAPGPRSATRRDPETVRRSRPRSCRSGRPPGLPSQSDEGDRCPRTVKPCVVGPGEPGPTFPRAFTQAGVRHRPVRSRVLDEDRRQPAPSPVAHRQLDEGGLPGGDLGHRDLHHDVDPASGHALAVPHRDRAQGEQDRDHEGQEDELLDAVYEAGDGRDDGPSGQHRTTGGQHSSAQVPRRRLGPAGTVATGRRRRVPRCAS